MNDLTRILQQIDQGHPEAAEELLPLVYAELRLLATRRLAREQPGQTLQATALVHEAWLRLNGDGNSKWNGRAHFFAAAAEAMRRILIENARRKRALRHGAGQQRLDLNEIEIPAELRQDQLFALDEALDRFAAQNAAKAELVKLRFFVGLTNEQAAEVMGLSVPTVKRYWTFARAWLYREMGGERTENQGRPETGPS